MSTATSNFKEISALSARRELIVVALTILLLVMLSAVVISQRQQGSATPRLLDWQVSAFYDLNSSDQAIYSALTSAADELWWLHNDILAYEGEATDDAWPTMAELGEYYFVSPFAEDLFWEQHGAVSWQRVAAYNFEGSTVYHGSGGDVAGQSAYLLMLSHAHKGAIFANGATIWFHPDANAPAPATIKRDSLIINGWKEVVPYSGEMEVNRLRRR